MADDRRRFPRCAVDVPALVVGRQDEVLARGANLHDLSEGGCCLRGFDAGSQVRRVWIDFVVLPNEICNATGEVVRLGKEEIGIAFAAVNDSLQRFMQALAGMEPDARQATLSRIRDPEIRFA
jgi:hypothetical protein